MNAGSVSFEYLLKARQLTWEDAESIDNLLEPVAAEEKSGVGKDIDRDSYENVNEDNHDVFEEEQVCRHDVDEATKGLCVHLDYNKLINVRVLLSYFHRDEYANKYSSSSDFCNKPPAPSDNTSFATDGLMTASSLPESSRVDNENGCAICHKKFKCKINLTRHLRTHTGEKPFTCPLCEKKFAQKSNLKVHLLVHSGIKAYSCDICLKAFAQKIALTGHRRTHTGDKPFKCNTCNAMFSVRSNLNVHTRTHTGETPYQCKICEKKFTRLGHLKIHLLTHSEEKPFACTYANCNKHFKRKDVLKRHIRSHTENKSHI